ncbi:hypothetical protein, conserved [Eimeria acervulina]|uniref:Protein kinase domain-containing protein n=1 Tax=Eimeria acervulina TaxID=5801 RepID=U6GGT5_EIMAC|nr:hypothetical protein, conserved [Eimeria acervulina]CDI79385.1 hypothetical protein, conserved [Eimeria acervulina]
MPANVSPASVAVAAGKEDLQEPADYGVSAPKNSASLKKRDRPKPKSSLRRWLGFLVLLIVCGVLAAPRNAMKSVFKDYVKLLPTQRTPEEPPERQPEGPVQPDPRQPDESVEEQAHESSDEQAQKDEQEDLHSPDPQVPPEFPEVAPPDGDEEVLPVSPGVGAEPAPPQAPEPPEGVPPYLDEGPPAPPADSGVGPVEDLEAASPDLEGISPDPQVGPTPPEATAPQKPQEEIEAIPGFDAGPEEGKAALRLAVESFSQSSGMEGAEDFGDEQEEVLKIVALALTDGNSRVLLGSRFRLTRPLRCTAPDFSNFPKGMLTVRGIVGFGMTSVYFTVSDEDLSMWTLRVSVLPGQKTVEECFEVTLQAAEAVIELCDGEYVASVWEDKRLLVPAFVADGWDSRESVKHVCGHTVDRPVGVMPELVGSVRDVLSSIGHEESHSLAAREYCARWMLIQTLNLQARGLSHNHLAWDSVFVTRGGMILLGEMGATVHFGELLRANAVLDPKYAEPQLHEEFEQFKNGGPPVKAHEKSDMWSLGVLLFEMFTGKPLEEVLTAGSFNEGSRDMVAAELQSSGASSSWQQLIGSLLQTDRTRRISATQIAEQFASLL